MERVKPTAYSMTERSSVVHEAPRPECTDIVGMREKNYIPKHSFSASQIRRDLGLSEGRAKELVEAIDTTVKDRVELRCDQAMGLIRKDIQSLKEIMDIRFNVIDEKFNALDVKFATKEDLANTKAEIIKWNLAFWAGTLISIAGLLVTAFKFYFNK